MVKMKRNNYPKTFLSVNIDIARMTAILGRLAEEGGDVAVARASYAVARRRDPRDTRSRRAFKKYDHLLKRERRRRI